MVFAQPSLDDAGQCSQNVLMSIETLGDAMTADRSMRNASTAGLNRAGFGGGRFV